MYAKSNIESTHNWWLKYIFYSYFHLPKTKTNPNISWSNLQRVKAEFSIVELRKFIISPGRSSKKNAERTDFFSQLVECYVLRVVNSHTYGVQNLPENWVSKQSFFCFDFDNALSLTSVVLTDQKRTAQILRAKTLRVLRQS